MGKKRIWAGIATLIVMLISGCAHEVKHASNRDASYQGRINQTIVVTSTPDGILDIEGPIKLSAHYYGRALDYLKKHLEKNGVKAELLKVDSLAIDSKGALDKELEKRAAKSVLTIEIENRKVSNYHPLWGRLWSQSYEIQISLMDMANKQVIWRSSFKVAQDYNAFTMDQSMEDLALKIVGLLKQDNLI